MDKFELVSEYQPTGDQPEAINALVDGINNGAVLDAALLIFNVNNITDAERA